jgi:hypothetical protein
MTPVGSAIAGSSEVTARPGLTRSSPKRGPTIGGIVFAFQKVSTNSDQDQLTDPVGAEITAEESRASKMLDVDGWKLVLASDRVN